MTSGPIPNVLLLPDIAALAHPLRIASRIAGLTIAFHSVANGAELKSRIQTNPPDMIVTGPAGLSNFPVSALKTLAETQDIRLIFVADPCSNSSGVFREKSGSLEGELLHFTPAELPQAVTRMLCKRPAFHRSPDDKDERWAQNLRDNQKLIQMGRMTASIAHEINNPLESLTNLLFLMENELGLPAKAHDYLKIAQLELGRVAQISRQTLNFSRETAAPVHSQIGDLLEEVLALYSRRIAEKQLKIVRRYEAHGSATVFPGEMRQVFSNLIANAIEASGLRGRITVRVRMARNWIDRNVAGLRVSIADNGSGIPLHVRRRLGEPFFTTKGQRGTGLGLWVSQSIVERYGGSLQLRSSVEPEHHGTVFSIFFPTNLRPRVVSNHADFEKPRKVAAFKRPA